ncbi:hypothetical protein ACHAWF_012111 [Thalassiosira exigua]
MTTQYPPSNMPVPGGPGMPGDPPGSAPGGGPPGGGPGRDDSYFTESRKGEVNELRQLLRTFGTERDKQRKRDIMKKVIAYMTLGIDVSRLFTEMMLAIETRDLVIKKMVYLFLCNYAETHPDLAQMCTNTLVKDSGNEDPMVRGLALRALCSLRLPQMIEYTSEPLRRSLQDGHAYVRKTGVMGILKMYHLNKEEFDKAAFNDILYDMLRDPDSSVVRTDFCRICQLFYADLPGMALNRAVMLHLLNRIHEFSEFGILSVLDLVPRYIPANDEEGYQIMNLLDPVLRTANAGAVVATIRAFLSISDAIGKRPGDHREEDSPTTDDMKRQVCVRIKAPLVTLIASGSNELTYVLLKYADQLIDLCPGIFDDEYRQFYVRYSDPTHIKHSKVRILAKLANPDTAPDIVAELGELVADVDETMGRLAVRSMGVIALHDSGGQGAVESIARRLMEMLDLCISHVSSEAATALASLVRRHPSIIAVVSAPLPRALRYITEPTGKASVIFLLGEYGESIDEAPYALEKVIDSYESMTDTVKTALLAATVKLFFQRPPELQQMLGRLLKKATEDVSSQDLHDRALFYYRLLRSSPEPNVVKNIISEPMNMSTDQFAEEDDSELRAALMNEFNTLCTVYRCKPENFVEEENICAFVKMPKEHPLPREAAVAPVVVPGVNTITDQLGGASMTNPTGPAPVVGPAPAPTGEVDLLGFGDDSLAQSAPSQYSVNSLQSLSLKSDVSLTGEIFESKWGTLPDTDAMVISALPMRSAPLSTDSVETALSAFNVFTMASGELPTEFKFFLYGQEDDAFGGGYFLIQAILAKTPPSMTLTIKTIGGDVDPNKKKEKMYQLVELLKSALDVE